VQTLVLLVSLVALVLWVPGCSDSAYDVGFTMGKKHFAAGLDLSAEKKLSAKSEIDRKTARYSCDEKADFLQGYLEGASKATGKDIAGTFTRALLQAARNAPQYTGR
jgi:hypothetical protein